MVIAETSEDYEKLSQKIYQNILSADSVNNIEVKHNVIVKGKSSTNHQIDVFWEYSYAGISHKVLIECKYYKDPVSLLHARNMLGLITDIPNSHGVIVTTQGYQAGVVNFCSHYGISLKIIRPPLGSDWDGFIQIVNISGTLYQNVYLNFNVEIDGKDPETLENMDTSKNITFNPYDVFIQENNSPFILLGEWLDKNIEHKNDNIGNIERTTKLTLLKNTFIVSKGKRFKLKSISVRHKLRIYQTDISIDAMDFVHAVLQDFNSGKIEYTLHK